ncbi:MAG: class I SAM-dependent methyltransferase [Sphingomonas sp.]|nr:class I SAM-dependent methyltransferase [Sphingomonas sp.]
MNVFQKYAGRDFYRLAVDRIIPSVPYLWRSRIRRCRSCEQVTLQLEFGPDEEFRKCFKCTANLRYEMLAEFVRESGDLKDKSVLELDSNTPVSGLLQKAGSYIASYFRPEHERGSVRADGVRMEDITNLTFADYSLDLIVSSDVLEHVPDIHRAFAESYRVLKPGGAHVFTVPHEAATMRRAELVDGQVRHLYEPEFHADPLDPAGIPVFWHFGSDLQAHFGDCGLIFSIAKGPEGRSKRLIWEARKPLPNA